MVQFFENFSPGVDFIKLLRQSNVVFWRNLATIVAEGTNIFLVSA
jgi:hypothetical protein